MKTTRLLLSVVLPLGSLLLGARRAEAAPASLSTPFCQDSNSPGVILESTEAQLVWDVYGNLTLVNHYGGHTQTTWGMGSAVPLTSTPATLCYGSGGNLKIQDSTGAIIWKSSQPNTTTNTLSLGGCTLSAVGDGGVKWQESTPACDRHELHNNHASDQCWTADTKLLWNDADQTALVWSGGRLFFTREGENLWQAGPSGKKVCYQADGNLVILSPIVLNSPAMFPVWTSGANAANTMMAMDRCGFSFSDTPNPLDQYQRYSALTCDLPTIGGGWRRKASAAGNVIANDAVRLDWGYDGHLKLWDAAGNLQWTSPNAQNGDHLEFQGDGNLVIFTANQTPLWSYSMENGGRVVVTGHPAALTLEGCSVSVVDQYFVDACAVNPDQYLKMSDLNGLCMEESNWKLWTKTPAQCLAPLPGGGFSFVKEVHAGDSRFGASTWIASAAVNGAGLSTLQSRLSGEAAKDLPSGAPPVNFLEVLGDAGVGVTLFGTSITVLEANGYAANINGPVDDFKFSALGATVKEFSAQGVFTPSASTTFFEAKSTFMLGFIPVIMTADVTGEIGATVNGYGGTDDLHLDITPYATLDLDASVGVGTSGASAGVEGSLNLVTFSVPFKQELKISTKAYTCSAEFDISTLAGELDLYAKLGPFKAKKEIASFDGYETSVQLFSMSSSL